MNLYYTINKVDHILNNMYEVLNLHRLSCGHHAVVAVRARTESPRVLGPGLCHIFVGGSDVGPWECMFAGERGTGSKDGPFGVFGIELGWDPVF